MDVFASAMGFFLFGCDYVFGVALIYKDAPIPNEFFSIQQPLIWFFKVFVKSGNICMCISAYMYSNCIYGGFLYLLECYSLHLQAIRPL